MTGIKQPGEKKLMLFSGRAYPELAEEVAEHLGVYAHPHHAASTSPTARSTPAISESVRGCDAFVHPEPHRPRSTSGSWNS